MTSKKQKAAPFVAAAQIMTRPVLTLDTGDTVQKAAQLFIDRNISGAPVLNQFGEPVGVITKTDIIRYDKEYAIDKLGVSAKRGAYAPPLEVIAGRFGHEEHEQDYVNQWMTPKVFTISSSASIASVVKEMARKKIHRIFVEDDRNGKLVGVITTFDLMKFLGRVFMVGRN